MDAISTTTSAPRAVAIRRSATARSTDTATCRARRIGLNGRACTGWRTCALIPAARSSSGVANSVTRSPGATRWSRPGQIAASSPSTGSTATGASAPYSSRSEARRGAVVRAARKRSPSSGISWMPDCRHASAIDGADSAATSSTDTSIFASARPTPGLPSWTTTRTSARSSRVSSAVSRVTRSSSRAQMTAVAPARPASARVAADRELAGRCGTPQPASWRASAGSGWSSMTTAGTPDRLSSSTIRRPTLRRPHTMTCPRQSA